MSSWWFESFHLYEILKGNMMRTCVCHLNVRNAELIQNVQDYFPKEATNNDDKKKTKQKIPYHHPIYPHENKNTSKWLVSLLSWFLSFIRGAIDSQNGLVWFNMVHMLWLNSWIVFIFPTHHKRLSQLLSMQCCVRVCDVSSGSFNFYCFEWLENKLNEYTYMSTPVFSVVYILFVFLSSHILYDIDCAPVLLQNLIIFLCLFPLPIFEHLESGTILLKLTKESININPYWRQINDIMKPPTHCVAHISNMSNFNGNNPLKFNFTVLFWSLELKLFIVPWKFKQWTLTNRHWQYIECKLKLKFPSVYETHHLLSFQFRDLFLFNILKI